MGTTVLDELAPFVDDSVYTATATMYNGNWFYQGAPFIQSADGKAWGNPKFVIEVDTKQLLRDINGLLSMVRSIRHGNSL